MRFELNPDAKLSWHETEGFRTPILVVDDVLANAEEVRKLALGLEYELPEPTDYWPGYTAAATLRGASALLRWVAEHMLQRVFPGGNRPAWISTDGIRSFPQFAILACDKKHLPATYTDQHADGGHWLATVYHLSSRTEDRGTAFWEHRPTGMQHWFGRDPMVAHALEAYLGMNVSGPVQEMMKTRPMFRVEDLTEMLFKSTPTARPFSGEDDTTWRRIHYVPAKFNRLVVYPTWQLHSIVDRTDDGVLDPETFRITFNQVVTYPFSREMLAPRAFPMAIYRPVSGL
jgi:hypothetical protein